MPQLTVDSTDGYTQHAASAGPVAHDWTNDTVTIKLSGKVVTTYASPLTWHAPDTGKCQNPAKLGAAWVDTERKIALVEIIQGFPRTTLVVRTDDYVRAEFKSAVLGFVDDVEFYLPPGQKVIYNGTDMCWEPSPQHHVISW
jgi:hypothetical protein